MKYWRTSSLVRGSGRDSLILGVQLSCPHVPGAPSADPEVPFLMSRRIRTWRYGPQRAWDLIANYTSDPAKHPRNGRTGIVQREGQPAPQRGAAFIRN